MEPALLPGDRLLVLPAGPGGLPGLRGAPPVGSVVIVERADRLDVKRIGPSPPGVLGLWLLGDHAKLSRDSRHDGELPLSALRGRVVFRIGPSGRRGRIPPAP